MLLIFAVVVILSPYWYYAPKEDPKKPDQKIEVVDTSDPDKFETDQAKK